MYILRTHICRGDSQCCYFIEMIYFIYLKPRLHQCLHPSNSSFQPSAKGTHLNFVMQQLVRVIFFSIIFGHVKNDIYINVCKIRKDTNHFQFIFDAYFQLLWHKSNDRNVHCVSQICSSALINLITLFKGLCTVIYFSISLYWKVDATIPLCGILFT